MKARRKRLGIWPHLLLTAAVGILFAVGVIGFNAQLQLRMQFHREVSNTLTRNARNLGAAMNIDFGAGGLSALNAVVPQLAEDIGGRIYVLDATGHVVADSHPGTVARCTGLDFPVTLTDSFGNAVLHAHICVPDPTGAAMLVLDEQLIRALLIPGIAGFLGALAVSLLLARRITLPLSALARAARHFGTGDLTIRVPVRGPSEVADLAGEFNRMAQGLEEAQRQRQALVADVAHELRTPLTVLRGYLEALRDGLAAPDPDTLGVIHGEAVHLQQLVDDLQDLAQADAAELALQCAPLDIGEILESVAAGFALQAGTKGVRIEVASGEAAPVAADRRRIAQIIHNLLANALRYTPTGGEIRLTAESSASSVRVEVTDTGVGIPAEHLPHIFERFYRVDPSRTRETGGSGLGLTIAKRIVEAHGGTMGVSSTVGAGTCFWFTLPRTK